MDGSYTNTTTVPILDEGLNATQGPGSDGCFIEPQLAFIVAAASGSLIFVLLISLSVISCKFITLKRQWQARRLVRSNVDLVSGSGHWSSQSMRAGIEGPCETNLLLEEVRNEAEEEEVNEGENGAMLNQNISTNMGEEKGLGSMQISTSRDSCIDPTKELEGLPLVV